MAARMKWFLWADQVFRRGFIKELRNESGSAQSGSLTGTPTVTLQQQDTVNPDVWSDVSGGPTISSVSIVSRDGTNDAVQWVAEAPASWTPTDGVAYRFQLKADRDDLGDVADEVLVDIVQ